MCSLLCPCRCMEPKEMLRTWSWGCEWRLSVFLLIFLQHWRAWRGFNGAHTWLESLYFVRSCRRHTCTSSSSPAERRDCWQTRLTPFCWWQKKTSATCWCWSLSGRSQAPGLLPAYWRWFLRGGPATQTVAWRSTKFESEPAKRRKGRLDVNEWGVCWLKHFAEADTQAVMISSLKPREKLILMTL